MFQTDTLGKNVIIYLRFHEVDSIVGFLNVCTVEKDGMEVSKKSIGRDIKKQSNPQMESARKVR